MSPIGTCTIREALLLRHRSPRMLVAACAAVVVAAAGAGTLLARAAGDGAADRPAPGAAAASPSAPPVLAAARAAPPPTVPRLATALAAAVRDPALGPQFAGIVLDSGGGVRWSRAAGTPLPPASTAKLATAVAALAVLGPAARLTTTVTGSGSRLVLVGGGDPLLASPLALRTDPALASVDALAAATAAEVRRNGVRTVSLGYDTSRYAGPALGPGWKPGYLAGDVAPVSALMVDDGRVRADARARTAQPAAAGAGLFAARLAAHGVRVAGAPTPARAAGPVLAAVSSPPVPGLVQRMLTDSDNNLAESLAREVAGRSALPRSFAGSAAAVRRAVADVGVAPDGLALVDGSGLSPRNRVRPATLADLLVAALRRPALHPLFAGLPVAGFTGTLADRFRRGPAAAAAGVVRAKTGTLSGVSTLAGVVVDRDGTLLAFALLAPRAPSRDGAQAALDRLAARLAACGCR